MTGGEESRRARVGGGRAGGGGTLPFSVLLFFFLAGARCLSPPHFFPSERLCLTRDGRARAGDRRRSDSGGAARRGKRVFVFVSLVPRAGATTGGRVSRRAGGRGGVSGARALVACARRRFFFARARGGVFFPLPPCLFRTFIAVPFPSRHRFRGREGRRGALSFSLFAGLFALPFFPFLLRPPRQTQK